MRISIFTGLYSLAATVFSKADATELACPTDAQKSLIEPELPLFEGTRAWRRDFEDEQGVAQCEYNQEFGLFSADPETADEFLVEGKKSVYELQGALCEQESLLSDYVARNHFDEFDSYIACVPRNFEAPNHEKQASSNTHWRYVYSPLLHFKDPMLRSIVHEEGTFDREGQLHGADGSRYLTRSLAECGTFSRAQFVGHFEHGSLIEGAMQRSYGGPVCHARFENYQPEWNVCEFYDQDGQLSHWGQVDEDFKLHGLGVKLLSGTISESFNVTMSLGVPCLFRHGKLWPDYLIGRAAWAVILGCVMSIPLSLSLAVAFIGGRRARRVAQQIVRDPQMLQQRRELLVQLSHLVSDTRLT